MKSEFVYGRNSAASILKNNKDIINIYLQQGFNDNKILKEINSRNLHYEVCERRYLDKLSSSGNHQGIIVEVKAYEYVELDTFLKKIEGVKNPLVLMLDRIEDPHNLGAILRSVDAVNAQGVIIAKHNQVPLNATVAKVSTGAIEHVDVVQVANLKNAIDILKEHGFWVVGAEANESVVYDELDYDFPTLLVVGSEGKGISPLVLKNCDYRVRIPMEGHVNSLNVSVASALLLYGVFMKRYRNK